MPTIDDFVVGGKNPHRRPLRMQLRQRRGRGIGDAVLATAQSGSFFEIPLTQMEPIQVETSLSMTFDWRSWTRREFGEHCA